MTLLQKVGLILLAIGNVMVVSVAVIVNSWYESLPLLVGLLAGEIGTCWSAGKRL